MNDWAKYLITWCILVTIPCPPIMFKDKFDRVPNSETLEWCITYEKDCGHSRGFNERDSAISFYKEALAQEADSLFYKQYSGLWNGYLINVQIDSLIKDTIKTSFGDIVVLSIYSKDRKRYHDIFHQSRSLSISDSIRKFN